MEAQQVQKDLAPLSMNISLIPQILSLRVPKPHWIRKSERRDLEPPILLRR
jgi:hypothetical protein